MSDRQLTTLDPDISALLDAERSIPQAPAGARQRVLGRLALTAGAMGAGFLAGAGAAPVAEAAPAPPTPIVPMTSLPAPGPVAAVGGMGRALSASLRLAMSCLVGAAVGGGIIYLLMRRPETAPALMPTPSPMVVRSSPPPSAIGLASEGGEPGVAAPSMGPPPLVVPARRLPHLRHLQPASRLAGPQAPPALEESGLEAERAILEGARAALALGDVKAALAATRQHERRFSNGQLVDFREMLMVRALAASGDTAAARARGAAFHRRFPASIFLPAVEATLQSLP